MQEWLRERKRDHQHLALENQQPVSQREGCPFHLLDSARRPTVVRRPDLEAKPPRLRTIFEILGWILGWRIRLWFSRS